MLKLSLCLSTCFILLTTATAKCSEYEYLHQQQLHQAKNVTQLADQLFGNDYAKIQASKSPLTFNQLFTLEQLLDEQRHNTLIEFHQSLSIAFDTNSNLAGLTVYGLTAKQQNRYALKLFNIPQWAEVSELFWFLISAKQFNQAKTTLLQMGLTKQDLKLIDNQISANNIFKIINEDSILFYENLKFELEMIDNDDMLAATARKISYQLKAQQSRTWFNWIKNLMSQLNPIKQQILFEYSKNNLGYQLIVGTSKSKQKSLDYAQRILTGEAIKVIENNLHMIEQQR